jgi:hypothetical protein
MAGCKGGCFNQKNLPVRIPGERDGSFGDWRPGSGKGMDAAGLIPLSAMPIRDRTPIRAA